MSSGRYEPCRYCGKNTQGYANSAWPLSGYICYDCKYTKYRADMKSDRVTKPVIHGNSVMVK